MELTLGSLFDGIAGFPLSASCLGIATKWASEIEAFPIKVSQKYFPDMVHWGDVTKVNGAEIDWVDIISFGSPCQDMSVAGKRAGLFKKLRVKSKLKKMFKKLSKPKLLRKFMARTRSGLFMEAVRIINEMREKTNGRYPRFAIWENVPGAFSSNNGNDFRAVLEEITAAKISVPKSGRWAEAGMVRGNGRSVAWRVLDAQYWGVPQRRKRIFLVADFTGECAGEILFEREGVPGNIEESGESWKEVASCVGDGVEATSRIGFAMQAFGKYADIGKSSTIKQRDYKDATDLVVCLNDTGGKWMDVSHNVAPIQRAEVYNHPPLILENHPADSRVKIDETGTTQTLTSRMGTGGGNVPMLMQPTYVFSSGNSQTTGLIGFAEEVSSTINSNGGGNTVPAIAFVANQRDEVRELRDKSGSLQAQQQPFIAQAFGPGGSNDLSHAIRAQASKADKPDKPDSTTYIVEPIYCFKGSMIGSAA